MHHRVHIYIEMHNLSVQEGGRRVCLEQQNTADRRRDNCADDRVALLLISVDSLVREVNLIQQAPCGLPSVCAHIMFVHYVSLALHQYHFYFNLHIKQQGGNIKHSRYS